MSIQEIKELSKETGATINTLLALSPKNDPFYIGTKTHTLWANWLFGYWQQFGYTKEVHIRRIHYQLISQAEPVMMPDGEPYENTMGCWKKLTEASKYLRYLGLIDCAQLVDRRSPPPLICHKETTMWGQPLKSEPDTVIENEEQRGLEIADFPFPTLEGLPTLSYQPIDSIPSYLLELWCEKSTMNDILEPICRRYGVNLVTGVGEISITRCDELASRVKKFGKPTRIFYLSDFDPAGQSMPVAVSRKIEWLLNGEGYDVRVFPILLSIEQVERYRLPRIPIKDTEKRAGRFEERFGEGATELDSLEALHPGELGRIILDALNPYLEAERSFRHATNEYNEVQQQRFRELNADVHREHQEDWEALTSQFETVKDEFSDELRELFSRYRERVEQLKETRDEIASQVEEKLLEQQPDLTFPTLEPIPAEETLEPLLNTQLPYLPQLNNYKRFQGRKTAKRRSPQPQQTELNL